LVKTLKKVGRGVLKVAGAPVRNAFLLIVKLNFRSLATNLKKAIDKAPSRVQSFWEGAGGRFQNLITAVNQGSKKRRLGTIGEPATATAVATATPLLIKVANLFKKLGISAEDVGTLAKKVIENKVQAVLEKAETQSETNEALVDQDADQISEESSPGGSFMSRMKKQSAVKLTNENGQEITTGGSGINKNILLIAGVGAVALLMMKKR
jgi:hypothetical protein